MIKNREQMNKAIKSIVVPHLKSVGFKGSFPHFYRQNTTHIDLLSFQFNLNGGSFVVEIAYVDSDRNNVFLDKDTPISKFRVSQTSKRLRLGAKSEEKDYWFVFKRKNNFCPLSLKSPNFEKIAQDVVRLIKSQGESWWQIQRKP